MNPDPSIQGMNGVTDAKTENPHPYFLRLIYQKAFGKGVLRRLLLSLNCIPPKRGLAED
jgi:hypothetical protein